jgi:hypothetical protein
MTVGAERHGAAAPLTTSGQTHVERREALVNISATSKQVVLRLEVLTWLFAGCITAGHYRFGKSITRPLRFGKGLERSYTSHILPVVGVVLLEALYITHDRRIHSKRVIPMVERVAHNNHVRGPNLFRCVEPFMNFVGCSHNVGAP